jgi:hypothetical protein
MRNVRASEKIFRRTNYGGFASFTKFLADRLIITRKDVRGAARRAATCSGKNGLITLTASTSHA